MGIKRWDNKVSVRGWDDKVDIKKQDNKRVVEPLVRACYTELWRLLCCVFPLVAHSNLFLAFSSSESMISWLLSLGSIANSNLLMTLIKHSTSSLR